MLSPQPYVQYQRNTLHLKICVHFRQEEMQRDQIKTLLQSSSQVDQPENVHYSILSYEEHSCPEKQYPTADSEPLQIYACNKIMTTDSVLLRT